LEVSYSLAAFPTLTKLYSAGNREQFVEQLRTSARHIIFLSLPAMVLFIVLRAQIVRTILGTGQFSWSDTRLTAAALALFIISFNPPESRNSFCSSILLKRHDSQTSQSLIFSSQP